MTSLFDELYVGTVGTFRQLLIVLRGLLRRLRYLLQNQSLKRHSANGNLAWMTKIAQARLGFNANNSLACSQEYRLNNYFEM